MESREGMSTKRLFYELTWTDIRGKHHVQLHTHAADAFERKRSMEGYEGGDLHVWRLEVYRDKRIKANGRPA